MEKIAAAHARSTCPLRLCAFRNRNKLTDSSRLITPAGGTHARGLFLKTSVTESAGREVAARWTSTSVKVREYSQSSATFACSLRRTRFDSAGHPAGH
jgi:hypothetical protein